jgi:hypothetical protein
MDDFRTMSKEVAVSSAEDSVVTYEQQMKFRESQSSTRLRFPKFD